MRSSLLVAPPSAVGPISEAPSYRTIDPTIYNGLPIELVGLIGGPPQPVSAPVPIPSDGMAMVFHLEGTPAPTPGTFSQQFTITTTSTWKGRSISQRPRPWTRRGATR